jgi:hypothetical protein
MIIIGVIIISPLIIKLPSSGIIVFKGGAISSLRNGFLRYAVLLNPLCPQTRWAIDEHIVYLNNEFNKMPPNFRPFNSGVKYYLITIDEKKILIVESLNENRTLDLLDVTRRGFPARVDYRFSYVK